MASKVVDWVISTLVGFAIEVGLYPVISEGIDKAPARVAVRFFLFVGSVYGMYKLLGGLGKWIDSGRR